MNGERPWVPGGHHLGDVRFVLVSPAGVNHLGFDDGQWFRLRQHTGAEPISAADAILLRPADIDQVIRVTGMWTLSQPTDPRATQLIDALSVGSKVAVRHFADLAGFC